MKHIVAISLIATLSLSRIAIGDCQEKLQLCDTALTMTELSLKAHQDALKEQGALVEMLKAQRDDAQQQALKAARGSSFLGLNIDGVIIGALLGGLVIALATK